MEKCIGCLAPLQNTGFFSTGEKLADHTFVCSACSEGARNALVNMDLSTTIFSSYTSFQVQELLVKEQQFKKFARQIASTYNIVSLQNSLTKKLFTALLEGENIVDAARAIYENRSGVLLTTDKRLLFAAENIHISLPEVINYNEIISVDMIDSNSEIRVTTSDSVLRFLKILWTEKLYRKIRNQITLSKKNKTEQIIPSQNSNDPSLFDIIERLGSFRQNGVITDEEFAEQKKKLLERL